MRFAEAEVGGASRMDSAGHRLQQEKSSKKRWTEVRFAEAEVGGASRMDSTGHRLKQECAERVV